MLRANMLTCLHAYMLTCLHAYMLTCLHAYMLTSLQLTCLHTYTLTCVHAYMHVRTCVHAYMHMRTQTTCAKAFRLPLFSKAQPSTGDARLRHSSMTSRPTALKRPLHRPLALNHRGTSRPTKTYFGHRLGNSMPTKSTYRRCLRTFFCE